MMVRAAALSLFILASGAAYAQIATIPDPGPGDPRIRQIMYDPDQIVAVNGQLGYEMAIEFDPNERIENVSIGDSLSWQVTPNRKATLLFLKPVAPDAETSMTVVTSKRIYGFVLTSEDGRGADDPDIMLRLRFLYPPPPPVVVEAPTPEPGPPPDPINAAPETLNFAYSYAGSKTLHPMRTFDDGKATYFLFDQGKDVPAIFVLGGDGREEMANTRAAGKYLVADFVAQTFVLRYGKAKTTVKNDALRPAGGRGG